MAENQIHTAINRLFERYRIQSFIEDYLEAYRRSLLETVKQGKKVRV